MIMVKVKFNEAFFIPSNDRCTMQNIFNDANFSGDGFGYFEAIYVGF